MRIAPVLLLLSAAACGAPRATEPVDSPAKAAREGRLADVLRMLDAGASVNSRSPQGTLPLVEAARAGHDTVVTELLAAGANPLLPDTSGTNAWDAVMQSGDSSVLEVMILDAAVRAGAGPTVMRWFAGVRGADPGPPLWSQVLSGELLSIGLMYAARHDRADLIATMRRGREIPNPTGYPALVVAGRWGNTNAVRALLAIDVHPDLESARRTTALMEAARDGHLAIATALLAAGADPNRVDRNGDTPLHWANRHNHPGYAAALRRAGADPDRRNVRGQRPAEITLEDGSTP